MFAKSSFVDGKIFYVDKYQAWSPIGWEVYDVEVGGGWGRGWGGGVGRSRLSTNHLSWLDNSSLGSIERSGWPYHQHHTALSEEEGSHAACLSVCPYVLLSVYLYFRLPICLPVFPSVFTVSPFVFMSILDTLSPPLSVFPSVFSSEYQSFRLSLMSVPLYICLTLFTSGLPSFKLSLCQSVCLSLYLSALLSILPSYPRMSFCLLSVSPSALLSV